MDPTIVIIGAGNVATHLAGALKSKCRLLQICSGHIESARALAKSLQSEKGEIEITDNPACIRTDADYYLIAVPDDAIVKVADMMPDVEGVVMHTSGSVGIDALSRFVHHGVFYPLQTFSKHCAVDVSKVPFFTEASDAASLVELDLLAASIGGSVHHADSSQRSVLHLAAVFACNFANHLWACADEILNEAGYPLDVLRPLLEVALDKALSAHPSTVQTGPAARGDHNVMQLHINMLPPDKADIYRLISASIISKTKNTAK